MLQRWTRSWLARRRRAALWLTSRPNGTTARAAMSRTWSSAVRRPLLAAPASLSAASCMCSAELHLAALWRSGHFIACLSVPVGMVLRLLQQLCARRLTSDHWSAQCNSGKPAHVRLPWVRCQRQAPSEASVLQEARAAWAAQPVPALQRPDAPQAAPPGELAAADLDSARNASRDFQTPPQLGPSTAPVKAPSGGTGPLLLFPDTSAMLAMLGARQARATATSFTMHLLEVCSRHPALLHQLLMHFSLEASCCCHFNQQRQSEQQDATVTRRLTVQVFNYVSFRPRVRCVHRLLRGRACSAEASPQASRRSWSSPTRWRSSWMASRGTRR